MAIQVYIMSSSKVSFWVNQWNEYETSLSPSRTRRCRWGYTMPAKMCRSKRPPTTGQRKTRDDIIYRDTHCLVFWNGCIYRIHFSVHFLESRSSIFCEYASIMSGYSRLLPRTPNAPEPVDGNTKYSALSLMAADCGCQRHLLTDLRQQDRHLILRVHLVTMACAHST